MTAAYIALAFALGGYLGLWAGRRKADRHSGITDSCGCIGCDFKLPRQRSHLGHYHTMNGDLINCTRL